MTDKRRFTVISNDKKEEQYDFRKERLRAYQTNPLKMQGESLREQFMRFTNGEGGKRFTVEDWLRS